MEKAFYDAESLRTALAAFEQGYELSSPDFYAAYVEGEQLPVPQFEQHVWASFYEDMLRMESNATTAEPVMGRVSRRFTASR